MTNLHKLSRKRQLSSLLSWNLVVLVVSPVSIIWGANAAAFTKRGDDGRAFGIQDTRGQETSYSNDDKGQVHSEKTGMVLEVEKIMVHLSETTISKISKTGTSNDMATASIHGFRVEDSSKPVTYDNGASVILADKPALIRFFGAGFTKNTIIRFVTEMRPKGSDCDDLPSTKSFGLTESSENSAYAYIQLPPFDVGESEYYVCTKEQDYDMPWVHQGNDKWITFMSYEKWLPLWAHICLLVILLALSGIFSGLNLGLMALDRTDLKIIQNTGTEKEKRYAKKIQPLRKMGNYLLCSLLLGNVIVNNSLTILLDDLTSGLIAVIGATLAIVIFGEIIPQAICARFGLAVGAYTIWLTKITMVITSPLSYPVSFILNKILGKEIGNVYNRERLRELIRVTEHYNDLKSDEVNVIEGVLKLHKCSCADAMTKLEKVFMLPLNAILDFETIDEIIKSGFSRIPVYDGERNNVVSILYTKDLVFVDSDDRMPIKSLCEFYQYQCNFVDEKKPLDAQFKEFKEGDKGHMAFVRKMHEGEDSDPFYEIIGVITLEDVIEELIQAEINDETDIKSAIHRNRHRSRTLNETSTFVGGKGDAHQTIVSPQLTLATFQFLSTSISSFHEQLISTNILRRLLSCDVFFKIKLKCRDGTLSNESVFIYEKGVPADYFVLILEGRVQASFGQENLVFEGGPFTYFGTQSLNPTHEMPSAPPTGGRTMTLSTVAILHAIPVPDYTVQATSDVTYLKISQAMYLAATQATQAFVGSEDCSKPTEDVVHKFDEQIGLLIRGNKSITAKDEELPPLSEDNKDETPPLIQQNRHNNQVTNAANNLSTDDGDNLHGNHNSSGKESDTRL
ncbi:metal transporter CNNM4 isoform X2 [Folsomia candida]|uniref:metal transporter CNNM4 isoform X2 n=1 Tax=Folsomia candida TaxID=158441 RepID=UPI0016051C07|nr:metal transporter CNNM4 isoform X2 [Folsomia candida]